jgi:acetyl-CoA carboxylase beta subunit
MLTKQKSRPICSHCGIVPAKFNGKSKLGFKKWHKYCVDCSKILYSDKHKHLQYKTLKCEFCNFKAEDKCQMDIVFKDGNQKNKKESNLKTLCLNCSSVYKKRLKKSRKSIMNITVDSDIRIS